jgi:hypothetical protein
MEYLKNKLVQGADVNAHSRTMTDGVIPVTAENNSMIKIKLMIFESKYEKYLN